MYNLTLVRAENEKNERKMTTAIQNSKDFFSKCLSWPWPKTAGSATAGFAIAGLATAGSFNDMGVGGGEMEPPQPRSS
ncbi:hypothetical protein ES288_A10G041400v1 [Gossypium darwinii]|uniref:Uncharacterized protein n=1 Tax=Gossypium darwinii TaxID=34276 RepID=A0A5D2EWZ7_GOSDA|nr:hypothetical protein ES288_A10G041400v1 [Gossypium darwinii]